MAAVPMTFVGMATGEDGKSGNVTLVGMASITGLGVGGGPIVPGDGDGKPPGIWGGGNVPMPTPPIANVPGLPPTQNPPGWGLHPAHPIVLPDDPPTEPPVDPPTNPPSQSWVWGYVPSIQAWQPVYVPAEGQAGPKT